MFKGKGYCCSVLYFLQYLRSYQVNIFNFIRQVECTIVYNLNRNIDNGCAKLIFEVFKYTSTLKSQNRNVMSINGFQINKYEFEAFIEIIKDAMPASFRLELFTSYILTIFKQ